MDVLDQMLLTAHTVSQTPFVKMTELAHAQTATMEIGAITSPELVIKNVLVAVLPDQLSVPAVLQMLIV